LGTKGVQPNISLVYNSQGGVGVMGKGWNISGLSAITRSGKTFFHDDRVEGIKFDNTDHFVCDGQILVSVNGNNGIDGTEYRTEIESYTRFYSRNTLGNGPSYFESYLKDGTILEYGNNASSRLQTRDRREPLAWSVSKVTDEYGNYMTFTYLNDSITGDFSIQQIDYTGNGTTIPTYNKVLFEYEDCDNFIKYYFDGYGYKKTKRLKYIKTYAENNTLVKTYEIVYENNTSNTLFSVSEIKERNYNDEELNSTKFTWENSTNSNVTFGNGDVYLSTLSYSTNKFCFDRDSCNLIVRFGDINGDGYKDIITLSQYNDAEVIISYYLNNGDNTFSTKMNDKLHYIFKAENLRDVMVYDWNKDGKDELIVMYSLYNSKAFKLNTNTNGFDFIDITLSGSISPYVFSQNGGYININYGYSYFNTDVNGDGLLDFVLVTPITNKIKCYLGEVNGHVNFSWESSLVLNFDIIKDRVFFGDVNGDGMSDMVIFHTAGVYVYLSNGKGFADNPAIWTTEFTYNSGWRTRDDIQLVDINGDGMLDIAGLRADYSQVYLSTGSSFVQSSFGLSFTDAGWSQPSYPWHYTDLNNDGLIDIVAEGHKCIVGYLNTGHSFVSAGFSIKKYYSGKENYKNPHYFIDMNGDNLPDYVSIGDNDSWISFGQKNDNLLIDSITDGFNNSISLYYEPYRQTHYEHSFSYPFSTIFGIPLVRNSKMYSHNNIISNIDYAFLKPVSHFKGKGFLGFQNIITYDYINGKRIEKNFELNQAAAILLPQSDTLKFTWIDNKAVITTHTFNIIQPNPDKRFIIRKIVETMFNLFDHNNIIKQWNYDVNGNITKSYKWVYSYPYNNESSCTEDTIVYQQIGGTNGWNFKPKTSRTKITNNLNESLRFDSTYYVYTNGKLDTIKKVFSNDTLTFYTKYSNYNSFGYPQTIRQGNQKLNMLLTSTYSYDSKGRWITRETNPVGNITSYTYEPKYGNCKQKTSTGITTKYEYDAWGRPIKTVYPDGDTITTTYAWVNDSYVPNGLYSISNTSNIKGTNTLIFDRLGREIRNYSNQIYENGTYTDTRYNTKGLVEKKSLPYINKSTDDANKTWTIYTYDNRNRLISEVGNLINNTYQYTEEIITNTVKEINNLNGDSVIKEYNHFGQLIKVTDAGGDIEYTYTLSGKVNTIISPSGTTTIEYDETGNRHSIAEPNAGLTHTSYNAFGNITKNIDAKGIITTNYYSTIGLLDSTKITDNNNTQKIGYVYFPNGNTYKSGLIDSVYNKNANSLTSVIKYSYDTNARVNKITTNIDSKTFVKDITYNDKGLVAEITYPTYTNTNRVAFQYVYNSTNGNLSQIKKGNTVLWHEKQNNELGQPVRVIYGNSTGTLFYYNNNHQLTKIISGRLTEPNAVIDNPVMEEPSIIHNISNNLSSINSNTFVSNNDSPTQNVVNSNSTSCLTEISNNIQRLYYGYNDNRLMTYRADSITNQKETFDYDDLQRLIRSTKVNGSALLNKITNVSYSNNGNILSKGDAGTYSYSDYKPNAITEIINQPLYAGEDIILFCDKPPFFNTINTETLNTNFNTFNKIDIIKQGNKELTFNYNPYQQRIKTIYKENNTTQKTKYFVGDYECELQPDGNCRELLYVPTPSGATIIEVKDNSTDSIYYVLKDHLGSYDVVVNQLGQIRERYSFDAWGNRRLATNRQRKYTSTTHLFDRGFTGHEHLDKFELINMNGRLYDPVIGRFLSPDNYVVDNTFTQDFNRYTYARNNPLMYTDPDGEFVWFVPVIIGAAFGTYSGGVIANEGNYNPFKWDWNAGQTWGYMIGGAIVGAISGYVGGTIANSGMPMANTAGIMSSSFVNSVGTHIYTGGQTPVSIDFGVASYDFTNNKWEHLGKKGNSVFENIGYGLGALANLSDAVSLVRGGGQNVKVNSAKTDVDDWWGHSAITEENGDRVVSFGPNSLVQKSESLSETWKNSIKGAKLWDTYVGEKGTWSVELNNVSTKALSSYASGVTRWDLLLNSCVGHTTRSLWTAGVPTLYLFHPHLLNVQLLIRQLGIYSSPYLYQIPKSKTI
jgi:RHS repeat-associated protein